MPVNTDMTLSRAIKLFLGGQSAETRRSYQYVLRYFEEYTHVTGLYLLSEVRPDHLMELIQMVVARPSVKSVATVNKYIKTTKVFFNWCIKSGFLKPPSPADAIKRKREPMAVSRQKAMPDDEYIQLADYVKWDVRANALVLFLADSADRIGGAANLKWEDIDLNQRIATVTEKGQDPRYVFFGKECCEALVKWRTKQCKSSEDYVFSSDGTRMTNDALGQYFTRKCHKAGIGNWGPHSLRHRKAYKAVEKGYPVTTVALMLGHKNPATTYKNYFPRDWKLAQQAIEALSQDHLEKPELPKIINDDLSTGS